MKNLLAHIKIQVNEHIYLKDPYSSELGKKIIASGIKSICDMGFEQFTFRKLAQILNTTESSIYRYFENKHKLLNYLTSWYWSWLEYQLVFTTSNLELAEDKLKIAINLLCVDPTTDFQLDHINIKTLADIVIAESPKAYLNKDVDAANKEGFYKAYKSLVARLSHLVNEINPDFEHPNTLISTIVEGIHHQKYFALHLPSLTNISKSNKLASFYFNMAVATIKHKS